MAALVIVANLDVILEDGEAVPDGLIGGDEWDPPVEGPVDGARPRPQK